VKIRKTEKIGDENRFDLALDWILWSNIYRKGTRMDNQKKTNPIGKSKEGISRREFIKSSAAVSLGAVAFGSNFSYAAGSDKIRLGVIGCGRRGTSAVYQAIQSSENVELYAMGDMFEDWLANSVKALRDGAINVNSYGQKVKLKPEQFNAPEERRFLGFDAYKKVLAIDEIDVVILTTPPGFRPIHLDAAIKAGKNVFMEKPVAVDPVGIRSVIASFLEIMKRIHRSEIGKVVAGQCYWNMDGQADSRSFGRQPGWSDMEWQLRCWYFFTWLSGDHIVEQHVHDLDAMNWAVGAHPVKALGMGGREVRKAERYGNIFDHFAVEYEYPQGQRILSMARQINGTSPRESVHVVGTKGTAYMDHISGVIKGENPWKYDGESTDPYIQEHTDLIASIRKGEPLNEGKRVAESTMTAILGRMSAYTGREISWRWAMKASKLDLSPPKYELGDLPTRPVSVPGMTPLV